MLFVDEMTTQCIVYKMVKTMVDTQYLEKIIADSGKKKSYLASRIGCSIQAFRLKCQNKYDFTLSQADILCEELGITKLSEKEKIFFKK